MDNVTLSWEQYKNLLNELNSVSEKIDSIQIEKTQKPILTNEEFMIMLGVSKRTAQSWRDEGLIKFSKIGKSIFYQMKDIEKFLNENTTSHLK